MLLQFTVENFKSIKDPVTLSMIASKDKEHSEYLTEFSKENLLPCAAIYGANASGKSNVVMAIGAALLVIRTSNMRQITDRMTLIVPFKFDKDTISKPTLFDFIFTFNGKKYQYGFSADTNRIYTEYLYEYNTAKPSMIFSRDNTNNYSFTKADEKEFEGYRLKTTDNKLFLATATEWNCSKTKDPYLWLAQGIDTFDGANVESLSDASLTIIDQKKNDNSFIRFMTEMLKDADINISRYDVKTSEASRDKFPSLQLPPGVEITDDFFKNRKNIDITTHHDIGDGDHKTDYVLSLNEESVGTRKYFMYTPFILNALKEGKTLVIDEIDSSLHPLLIDYLIRLFSDKSINRNHAQLICTTHETSMLNLDTFRRDQIYFTEKENSTGVTDLYSLDEYSPRKSENIRKGYLQGRYGAIPFIGSGDIKW
jgi:AAA15 family ATPase/GTPase